MLIAFILCFFVVYGIHRASMDHAWKIAIVVGIIVNLVPYKSGNLLFHSLTSFSITYSFLITLYFFIFRSFLRLWVRSILSTSFISCFLTDCPFLGMGLFPWELLRIWW